VGVGPGMGKPVPVGGRSRGEVYIPVRFGGRGGAGYHETGVGAGVLKPRPVAMSNPHV